jgi:hypothetical protein
MWGAVGVAISVIAAEMILIHPAWHPVRLLLPAALLTVLIFRFLSPSFVDRLRAKARRWQGLEGGTAWGSNLTRMLSIMAWLAIAVTLAVSNARAAHAKACAGTGRAPQVALANLILATPSSYQPVSQSSGLGQLSKQTLASSSINPSATRQLLSCNGFQTGYGAAWRASGPSRGITVRVYEFSSASGAARYGLLDARATGHNLMGGTVPMSVTDVTTPVLTPTTLDAYGNYIGYQFAVVDRFVVVVRLFRSDRPVTVDDLHPFVQAQVNLLAAVPEPS